MKTISLTAVALMLVSSCSNTNDQVDDSSPPPTDQDGVPSDHSPPGDEDAAPTDDDPEPGDADASTNIPPDTVLVGGPPETCVVYELDIPIQRPDGEHHPEGTDLDYDENPPVGGPSYEMWAAYDIYEEPVARERWTHNLRHGAIVLIYRPDAPQEVIDALTEAYQHIPNPGGKYESDPACPAMGIMTPDPELDETFAVLAFGKMMTSNCAPTVEDVADFAERHIYEAPEKECWNGAWPVRGPCQRYEDVRYIEWTYEVAEGTEVTYQDYPPSSGPYYPSVLKYGRYDQVVPTPYWTGILAKGGIVVLYRPDAPAELVAGLEAAYDALPNHGRCPTTMTAMVQDPNLETPWAMVGFGHYMEGQCFQGWEMAMFVTSRRGWAPLDGCVDGTYVP